MTSRHFLLLLVSKHNLGHYHVQIIFVRDLRLPSSPAQDVFRFQVGVGRDGTSLRHPLRPGEPTSRPPRYTVLWLILAFTAQSYCYSKEQLVCWHWFVHSLTANSRDSIRRRAGAPATAPARLVRQGPETPGRPHEQHQHVCHRWGRGPRDRGPDPRAALLLLRLQPGAVNAGGQGLQGGHLWPAGVRLLRQATPSEGVSFFLTLSTNNVFQTYLYSIPDQAELMMTLLTKLGLDSAHFIAHDLADSIMMEVLARRERGALPDRYMNFFKVGSKNFQNIICWYVWLCLECDFLQRRHGLRSYKVRVEIVWLQQKEVTARIIVNRMSKGQLAFKNQYVGRWMNSLRSKLPMSYIHDSITVQACRIKFWI